MPDWLPWLIAAGALATAESLSGDFTLIMLAGGAGAGSVTAAFGAPVFVQALVALVGAIALLLFVRPVAKRHMTKGPLHITGSARLVGERAVVLSEVTEHAGLVKLNGAEWTARPADPDAVYPAGKTVRVMQISGATAVVFEEPFD